MGRSWFLAVRGWSKPFDISAGIQDSGLQCLSTRAFMTTTATTTVMHDHTTAKEQRLSNHVLTDDGTANIFEI